MKLKPFLLGSILSIAGLCFPSPARAQFLGYTSPQTVSQTLASGVSCTGSVQTFIVANLGQTEHAASLSLTGGVATFVRMEIDGIDGSNAVYPISDIFENSSGGLTGAVNGIGYFPRVQVLVKCSPVTARFNLNYSGSSSFVPIPTGAYQIAQTDKYIFNQSPANATASETFQAPFANSLGSVTFQFTGGAGPAGSALSLACNGATGNLLGYNVVIPLATATAVQQFQIPASPCPQILVSYTSGGASASNFTLEYSFSSTPSSPSTQSTVNPGCVAAGTFSSCSPSQLGVNALPLPGSGTSSLSNVIDTRGAKEATLLWSCTQGASVNVQTYAEDGVGTQALVTPVSAVPASTFAALYLGSEANPATNLGTLSTTALLRMPERALAFSFTNGGASAGACTARLLLSY